MNSADRWLFGLSVAKPVGRAADQMAGGGGVGCPRFFLVAGLFEYNFGDSEVLMLFMLLVPIPCGMARSESRGCLTG